MKLPSLGQRVRLPLGKRSAKLRGPEGRVAWQPRERAKASGAPEPRVAMLWPFSLSVQCGQPQALPSEPPASLRGY